MMNFVRRILLWEQRWVRWSGREEIRWLCPPRRSLRPRRPSDAAASLLSISGLPSRNLPHSSRAKTYIHMQSVLYCKIYSHCWTLKHTICVMPWGRKCVVRPILLSPSAGKGLALTPVSHLDEPSLLVAWGWGNGHQCSRHRCWRTTDTDNMFVFVFVLKEPCHIHPDSG